MESERQKAIEEALQLQPEEEAIVIIKNNNTDIVDRLVFHLDYTDASFLLAWSLEKILYDFLSKQNMSKAHQLIAVEKLLEFIRNKYKKRFFKEGENT